MNTVVQTKTLVGDLQIDSVVGVKINEALQQDKFNYEINGQCFIYVFEDGYKAEVRVVSEKDMGGTTFLNPILFNKKGFEITYLDAADYKCINDEFVFEDERDKSTYKLSISFL